MNDGSVLDGWGVLRHAAELARRGEEFVLATVVWREGPSSGQNGSRAIVMPTGEVIGWIGGACAEPVLIREAHQALAEQRARLLALGTSEQFGDVPQGMTAIAISCQSEGALQIFIEPVIPVPHLVVVGRSPMAHTLCELARALAGESTVDGVEFDAGSGELWVTTREPHELFAALPAAAANVGVAIRELGSEDDSLDAVFEYLVGDGL